MRKDKYLHKNNKTNDNPQRKNEDLAWVQQTAENMLTVQLIPSTMKPVILQQHVPYVTNNFWKHIPHLPGI